MKKRILAIVFMTLSIVALNTSCKKVEAIAPTETQTQLSSQLANDDALVEAIVAAKDLYVNMNQELLNNDVAIARLKNIIDKMNAGTASTAEIQEATDLLGMSYDDFIARLKVFGTSLAGLANKYPELSKMDQTQLQDVFATAIKENPSLQQELGTPALINGRVQACPLRDICNLAVTLTNLFAGQTICAAIGVTTIPVVGGLLCQIILQLGVAILTGICNALPC
ncbi:MAG: hypothetical protein H6553_08575 [Chitinophagales bacterium]|nr:hypothetical protein [Chitinophagales bacterium]